MDLTIVFIKHATEWLAGNNCHRQGIRSRWLTIYDVRNQALSGLRILALARLTLKVIAMSREDCPISFLNRHSSLPQYGYPRKNRQTKKHPPPVPKEYLQRGVAMSIPYFKSASRCFT